MAIAPIQRRRTDSGLQASIARSALQSVMQEQDARGQIMQRAQAMNQLNLRRQDQNFRDVQRGFFTNRQFNADEEQRAVTNELRQAQEDRMQQKFAADMELRDQLDPLRVKQAQASIARTNRVGTGGGSSAITSDLPLPSIGGRRTFESIDARVSPDGTEFAPRGGELQEPALPSSVPPRATPVSPDAAPVIPSPAPAAPVAQPQVPLVGPPDSADPLAFDGQPIPPAQRIERAGAVAQEAQEEINETKKQAVIAAVELNPQQAQVADALSMFGDKWGDTAAQYFRNGNAEKVLEAKRKQVQQEVMLEKIEVMGEDFGLGTWDARVNAPFIQSLTTEERILGKIPFQQAAMQSMLAAKRRRDPKVRNLTTSDIEMIDKAWPAPDPKEIEEQSMTIQADTAVLQLQDRFKAAKTPNEQAIIENIARADEVFGKTGEDRDAVVTAALRGFKTAVEAPDIDTVQDAIFTMEYFKANPESRSKPWSPGDKDAVRRAEIALKRAEAAGMLTPDGALRQSAAKTSGASSALFPPAAVAQPQRQGGARKLLGIGAAANLTK